MKRYFFDLHDGVVRRDVTGYLFENDAAAWQEAKLRALSYKETHRLETYDGFEFIVVRDQANHMVWELQIER